MNEHRRLLIVGAAVLLAVRLLLSATRSGPVIMADEAGYLMNARVLADGLPANMGSSPFYRGGYSALIAPLLGTGAAPVTAYHLVLVLNAVLVTALVPLLYVLLTRCFGVESPVAAWSAVAGAAYPTVTALSQVAMSENLLFVGVVLWLLGVGRWLLAPRSVAHASAAGAAAALLWAVHGRMAVVVALTLVGAAAAAIRRDRRRAAAAAVATLVGGMVAGRLLNAWLVEHSYGGRHTDEFDAVRSSLDLFGVVRNLAGHAWYLAVATLGIALVLLVTSVPGALARVRRRAGAPADNLLLIVIATTLGLLAVSAIWLSSPTRADQLIYGRYTEPIVPVLVAIGVATLRAPLGARQLLGAIGALAGLTLVVIALRAAFDPSVESSRWNIAALPSVTGAVGPPVLLAAGAVAAVATLLVDRSRRRSPVAPAIVALALFLPVTVYTIRLPVLRSQHDVYPRGWTTPRPAAESRKAATVAYDLDHFDHVAVKVYQWFMPRTRFVTFHSTEGPAPVAIFFSSRRRLAGETRAERVWQDPGRDQAMWARP